jgi:tetratricopeptide (TPR) repeat protein
LEEITKGYEAAFTLAGDDVDSLAAICRSAADVSVDAAAKAGLKALSITEAVDPDVRTITANALFKLAINELDPSTLEATSTAKAMARQGLAILRPLVERREGPTAETLAIVGRLESLLGQYADAEQHLLQALALAEGDTSQIQRDLDHARMHLRTEAHRQFFLRRFEEALVDAEAAVRAQPEDAWAHYQLGYVLEGLDRYQEALTEAEIAVRLSGGRDAGFHAFLGSVLFSLQRWEPARLSYERAAELDQAGDSAPHSLALCLINLRRYREAAAWLQEVLRRKPDHKDRMGILSHIEELRSRTDGEPYHPWL